MLLLLIVLINVVPTFHYSSYTKQQTQQIQTKQRQQWNAISIDQKRSESMSFILKRRIEFFTKPQLKPNTIKMKGKVYFMDDHRKFIATQFLSPYDVTKIYVYSQSGIIIQSQQFHEMFAFQFPIKSNQKYQIVFSDGPPGPLKLIHLQIDYSSVATSPHQQLPSNQTTKSMSTRLSQIQSSIYRNSEYTKLSTIKQNAINENFVKTNQYYQLYITTQIIIIIVIMLIQVAIARKLLSSSQPANIL